MSSDATATTSKGELRLTHKDEGNHLARGIKIALDGKELGLIKSGKSVVIDVDPGQHELRVDNTFHARTEKFEVRAGEQVHYRIWNKRGFGSWLVDMLGAGPTYLSIERAEP